jgi:hypothetical protein
MLIDMNSLYILNINFFAILVMSFNPVSDLKIR